MRQCVLGLAVGIAAIGISASASAGSAPQGGFGITGYYGAGLYAYQEQFYNSSIPFSASASDSIINASSSVAIQANERNGNVGLHGFSQAVASQLNSEESGFDIYAYDTFKILGPSGTPEAFSYSLTLNGSAQVAGLADGVAAYGGSALFVDSIWNQPGSVPQSSACTSDYDAYGNQCGQVASVQLVPGSPSKQNIMGTIYLTGGSTVELGDWLWARALVVEAAPSASATFDASDTGFFTLTPITPGAGFTTASGLTYAASPDVPEPATWMMLILGVAMIGFAARRRSEGMALAT